jgi:hypothetical protein
MQMLHDEHLTSMALRQAGLIVDTTSKAHYASSKPSMITKVADEEEVIPASSVTKLAIVEDSKPAYIVTELADVEDDIPASSATEVVEVQRDNPANIATKVAELEVDNVVEELLRVPVRGRGRPPGRVMRSCNRGSRGRPWQVG